MPWMPLVGGLLALLCLWAAMRANRHRRLIDNLPTSKTTGIFIGLVEVKGTAEAEQPLRSHLAETSCVLYEWTVEEHWSRTVTETYTDSKGKTRTRTRHESGWRTVDQGGEAIPFYLQDDEGVVRVIPEGAKIEPTVVFQETCGRMDPLYYGKGPVRSILHSDHRRRFVEKALPLHAPLYVMGRAREREDVVAAEIAAHEEAPMFLISTRDEQTISSGLGVQFWVWLVVGFLLALAGVLGADLATERDPVQGWWRYALAAAGYWVALACGWVWTVYNSLIDLRQRVRRAWSHIDVQLKRRHDLIPNLIQAVEGLRTHEQETQTALVLMRTQLQATAPGTGGPDFQGCAGRLIALRENHPELTADDAFQRLHHGLVETEQRIALARGYFNEIATAWNTRMERVPDRFVARPAGMKPEPLMAAAGFERAAVKVNLVG
ncbi:MAG: LemA family protein [Verrucomicrobiales bacterium]|nr:LemA family protein [Verrucomicrobiales bacterium]